MVFHRPMLFRWQFRTDVQLKQERPNVPFKVIVGALKTNIYMLKYQTDSETILPDCGFWQMTNDIIILDCVDCCIALSPTFFVIFVPYSNGIVAK